MRFVDALVEPFRAISRWLECQKDNYPSNVHGAIVVIFIIVFVWVPIILMMNYTFTIHSTTWYPDALIVLFCIIWFVYSMFVVINWVGEETQ